MDPAPTEAPCPGGQVLDGELCQPERCGAGAWGSIERATDTVHVAGWGTSEGDGSEERPLRQIAPAVALALSRGQFAVAIAEGEYESRLVFGAGTDRFELRGRCADLVVLQGAGDGQAAISVAGGGDVVASGLRVSGEGHGVEVDGGSTGRTAFEGEDLVFEGWSGSAASTIGPAARLTLRNVAMRGGRAPDGLTGVGVWVDGGRAFLRGLEIDGVQGVGVYLGGADSELDLAESSIAHVEPAPGGSGGLGMTVLGGATAQVERTGLADLIGAGILVEGSGSRLEAAGLSVERVTEGGQGGGVGVILQSNAILIADGLVIRDVEQFGLFGTGDVTIELHDALIEDVLPLPDAVEGGGLDLRSGAVLVGDGIEIARTTQGGLLASGSGTTVEVTELVVRDVLPSALGIANAVQITDGASLTATDLLVEDSPGTGVAILAGGVAVLERPTVRDTRPLPDPELGQACYFAQGEGTSLFATDLVAERCARLGLAATRDARFEVQGGLVDSPQPVLLQRGRGVGVQTGGTLVAADLRVQGHGDTGVVVVDGSAIEVDGLVVAEPSGQQGDEGGRGIQIGSGSTLIGRDLVVEHSRGEGLVVWGATATLDGLTVTDTVWRGADGSAAGVVVWEGGALTASRVRVEGNDTLGVLVDTGGVVELSDGFIRDSKPRADGGYGHAVQVTGGGRVLLRDLVVSDVHNMGILAVAGQVDLRDVTVEQVHAGNHLGGSLGVIAQGDATVDLQNTIVRAIDGPALYVTDAVLRCTDCTVQDTEFAGIAAIGGEIDFTGGSVEDVAPSEDLGGGVGLYARPSPGAPQLTFTDTEFRGTVGPALYLLGAGRYDFDGVRMTDPAAPARAPAVMALDGVLPWSGASGLRLSGGEISGFGHVGLLLEASGATLDGVGFGELGGVDVFRQHCDDGLLPLEVLSGAPNVGGCDGAPYDTDPMLSFQLDLLDFLEVEP